MKLDRRCILLVLVVAISAPLSAAVIYSNNSIRWSPDLKVLLFTSILLGCLTTALSQLLRIQLALGLLFAVSLIYFSTGSGSALLGVASFWFVCFAVGCGAIQIFLEQPKDRERHIGLALVVGYVLVTLILTILAFTTLNSSAVYVLIFGSLTCVGIWLSAGNWNNVIWSNPRKTLSTFDSVRLISQSLFCGTVFVLCLASLLPETGSDAVAAYRSIIVEMIGTGGFVYNPETSAIRLQPLMGLWPQLFGSILTSDASVTKAINFSTILATSILFYVWLKQRYGPTAAALSMACILATPILFLTSVSAFLDNALIFLVVGILTAVSFVTDLKAGNRQKAEKPMPPAWKVGVILGLISVVLTMTKMTSLFLAPAIAIFIVASLGKIYNVTQLVKLVIAIVITSLAIFGTFSLFVFCHTGNPIFPYFNEIFQSPYFPIKNFSSPHGGYVNIRLFWDLMINTNQYASIDGNSASSNRDGQLGVISILVIFGLLALLLRRSKINYGYPTGLALLCAVIGIVTISAMQNNSRYILPVLPFIGIAISAGFSTLLDSRYGGWLALFPGVAMIAASLSLLPQYGYNPTKIGGILKVNHAEIIREVSAIQLASDRLSALYGSTGRVVFDHRDGGFEGRSLVVGWYDPATGIAYRKAAKAGATALGLFMQEHQVDAFVMTPRTQQRTNQKDRFLSIQTMEQLASSIERVGGVLIFHFPPQIGFPQSRTIELTDPTKARNLIIQTGAQTAVVDVVYACIGQGSLRLVGHKLGLLSYSTQNAVLICDGTNRRTWLRVNEINAENNTMLQIFFKDIDFSTFKATLHWR